MIRQDAHTNPEVLHLFPRRAQAAGLACCEECGHSITADVGQWTDDPDIYYEHENSRVRCWQVPSSIPDYDWEVPEVRLIEARSTVRLKPGWLKAV
jgi:hypothetical protein